MHSSGVNIKTITNHVEDSSVYFIVTTASRSVVTQNMWKQHKKQITQQREYQDLLEFGDVIFVFCLLCFKGFFTFREGEVISKASQTISNPELRHHFTFPSSSLLVSVEIMMRSKCKCFFLVVAEHYLLPIKHSIEIDRKSSMLIEKGDDIICHDENCKTKPTLEQTEMLFLPHSHISSGFSVQKPFQLT